MENPVFLEESTSPCPAVTDETSVATVTVTLCADSRSHTTDDLPSPSENSRETLHVDMERDLMKAGSSSSLLELPDGLAQEERVLEMVSDLLVLQGSKYIFVPYKHCYFYIVIKRALYTQKEN